MPQRSSRLAADALAALAQRGLRRKLRVLDSAQGRSVVVDGCRVVNFSANDYLGLAAHPALVDAAARALSSAGHGAGASRLIVGNQRHHVVLEAALARYQRRDGALLFNSGYHANLGVVPVLAGQGDAIFSDALNHASLIDGCRLSRAQTHVFRHGDMGALRRCLREVRPRVDRALIVSETVFSMDGDRAEVAALAEIAAEFDAMLALDEAHALGVLGPEGRGLAADADVIPDVQVGTLGKALGSFGAFVVADAPVIELLLNRARTFVFTTALPASVVAATEASLAIVAGEEGARRREHLRQHVEVFRHGLERLGLLASGSGATPIFPVWVGGESRTMECSARLFAAGLYVQGIRPPTVPRGTSRLRFSLMATHRAEDLDAALAELACLVGNGLVPRYQDVAKERS